LESGSEFQTSDAEQRKRLVKSDQFWGEVETAKE